MVIAVTTTWAARKIPTAPRMRSFFMAVPFNTAKHTMTLTVLGEGDQNHRIADCNISD
jgi:hypothetical protein